MITDSEAEPRETVASDKCHRWRKITLDQMSYVQNLTLTFAVAALGYWFVLVQSEAFKPATSAKVFMILSLIALAGSGMSGFSCAINRLLDFRGTARRTCNHPQAPTKDELRDLGDRTWSLLYWQVALFGLGTSFLAVTLLLTYGHKLT